MKSKIENTLLHSKRWSKLLLCLTLTSAAAVAIATAADISSSAAPRALAAQSALPAQPRKFEPWIAEKLGVKHVAYLLAVDVNGNVVPFVPDDPKASFRFIDPAQTKLTMTLSEISPFTLVAGKRNPFCVLFIGGSARRVWMESCP